MSTTNTQTPEPDLKTLAGRVLASGGGGLPESVLKLAEKSEQKKQTILADHRFTDAHRREQLAANDEELEAAIFAAREAAVAEARKDAESRKSKLLAELRGQFAHHVPAITETASEQAERHYRSTRDTIGLLPDLMAAQASDDPSDLLDQLEEAIQAEQHTRIRKLAPVIIGRLGALSGEERDGAAAAWMLARTQYANYKKAHPSVNARLKAADDELRNVAAPIERQYERALEFFRVGRAKHGMRL